MNVVGLQTDSFSWMLAFTLLAVWLAAFPLLVPRPRNWRTAAGNLLALSWLGFGVSIVARFFLLTYDSVTYGNNSTRLADRLPSTVNHALDVALIYLVAFVVVGYMSRFLPTLKIIAAPAATAEQVATRSFVPWTVIALVCVVLPTFGRFPVALVTPVSLLGSLWVFLAAIAWWRRFAGLPIPNSTLALVLIPGIVHVVLLPYRENFLLVCIVPLFAALAARRRVRFSLVFGAAIVGLVVSTILISTYRLVLWRDADVDVAVGRVSLTFWDENPLRAPWNEIARRFHAFDSLLLTVDLIPDVFPYSGRNVFVEAVTRGVVPRMAYANKRMDNDGVIFSTTIWSFDDPAAGAAAIAPSMPGNLFESGGVIFVWIGAACWALLIGWIDKLKTTLAPASAAGIHLLFAFQALGGIERDYPHSVATIIQNLIVLSVAVLIVGRAGTAPAPRRARAVPQRRLLVGQPRLRAAADERREP